MIKVNKEKMRKILNLLVISFILYSCSSEQRIKKAVDKVGKEYAVGYMKREYPEMFITKVDTLRDTVRISSVKVDSVFSVKQLLDTITIVKDRYKTKIWVKHDSVFVQGECAGDTIYIEKPIIKYDVDGRYIVYSYIKDAWDWIKWLLLCSFLLSLSYLAYRVYRRFVKPI